MNFLIMLFGNLVAGADLVREIEKARTFMRTGKVGDASQILTALYKQHPADANVRINYAKFLYSCGEYEALVRDFGDSTDQIIKEIVGKAQQGLKKAGSESVEDLEGLLRESKYARGITRTLVGRLLSRKMFAKAKDHAERLLGYYGEDRDIAKLCAHAHVLTSTYSRGIEMFKRLGLGDDVARLESLAAQYTRARGRPEALSALLQEISLAELEDSYKPSLYTYLKYECAMYELVKLGVESRSGRVAANAEELHKHMGTDETAYFYVMALIPVDEKRARAEYAKADLKDKGLRRLLDRELLALEEKRKQEEKKKQEESSHNESQRRPGRGTEEERGTPSDHLGYYKILGVCPSATSKEIKSAFLKKTKENNCEHYKSNAAEYKRREDIQKKLNKAHDVLKSPENRKKYDQGAADAQGGGEHGHDARGFDDLFKMFFGRQNFGGAGGEGHGRQGGHSYGHQGGQRTYYYYYV